MSFFTEGDSDPSVEQKRKYAVMTNLGAESDFAALDSNFRRLGASSTLQKTSNSSHKHEIKSEIFCNGFKEHLHKTNKFLHILFQEIYVPASILISMSCF